MQSALRRCGTGLVWWHVPAAAQGLDSLQGLLPSLAHRAGLATHGVANPGDTKESGVPRFYQTVNVKEAFEQARWRGRWMSSAAAGLSSCVALSWHSLPCFACPQGGYQVFLDHRVLRTPARHPVVLPSLALATAVAAEWEMQVRAGPPGRLPAVCLRAVPPAALTTADRPATRRCAGAAHPALHDAAHVSGRHRD